MHYVKEEKQAALDYFKKVKSYRATVQALGYPSVQMLRKWVEDAGIHVALRANGRKKDKIIVESGISKELYEGLKQYALERDCILLACKYNASFMIFESSDTEMLSIERVRTLPNSIKAKIVFDLENEYQRSHVLNMIGLSEPSFGYYRRQKRDSNK